jgi:hypothetical protein
MSQRTNEHAGGRLCEEDVRLLRLQSAHILLGSNLRRFLIVA